MNLQKKIMEMNGDLKEIFYGYIDCAYWVNDEDQEFELTESEKLEIANDCEYFLEKIIDIEVNLEESQIGHDLYLTRNDHGTGFWDRGLPIDISDKLCSICKEMGEDNRGIN